MYILVYTLQKHLSDDKKTKLHIDSYEAFETFEDARTRYEEILQQDDLYIASITSPIISTDYNTPEEVNKCSKCGHLYVKSEQKQHDYCPNCMTHQ